MDFNVINSSFRHVLLLTWPLVAVYAAATGLPFFWPIASRDGFADTWKKLTNALELGLSVSVADPSSR